MDRNKATTAADIVAEDEICAVWDSATQSKTYELSLEESSECRHLEEEDRPGCRFLQSSGPRVWAVLTTWPLLLALKS